MSLKKKPIRICLDCGEDVIMHIENRDYRHCNTSMDVHERRYCKARKKKRKKSKDKLLKLKRCYNCSKILLRKRIFCCKKCRADIPKCVFHCSSKSKICKGYNYERD